MTLSKNNVLKYHTKGTRTSYTYPKGPEAANKWQMQVFNGAWDEEGGSIFVK